MRIRDSHAGILDPHLFPKKQDLVLGLLDCSLKPCMSARAVGGPAPRVDDGKARQGDDVKDCRLDGVKRAPRQRNVDPRRPRSRVHRPSGLPPGSLTQAPHRGYLGLSIGDAGREDGAPERGFEVGLEDKEMTDAASRSIAGSGWIEAGKSLQRPRAAG